MKGALVGYGTIADGHHRAYLKLGTPRVVAVVDASPERRDAARLLDPGVAVYGSIDDLLAAQMPDFVDICLPPSMHLECIEKALDAGCHVLCEKPFLPNLAAFDRLLEVATQVDRFIYPGHNYKFSPAMRRLIQQVHSPTFGVLLRGFFLTRRKGHARGVAAWRPDWRREPEFSCGGILQDHATHSVYLACDLCDAAPEAVSCILGNLSKDAFAATEDTALMTLHFPGGTEIRLDLTWACEHRHTSYALFGSSRNVMVENDTWQLSDRGAVHREELASDFDDPTHRAWFVDMLEDFIGSIGDRPKQTRLMREAWLTCAVIEAAYASARAGGVRVAIPPLPASLAVRSGPSREQSAAEPIQRVLDPLLMTDTMRSRYAVSHELAEHAARYDAWLTSELHNPHRRNYQFIDGHYPLYGARGEGAYLWDVDGNRYIDFNLGYGTVLLGHAHAGVIGAVYEEIARGHCLSPLWKPLQAELCELVCRSIPNGEQAFLMRTGSDASSGAVRLARLFTGRKRVLRWGYNGWHDWSTPRPGGVPAETRQIVHSFTYNDLPTVERLFEQYRDEIACVFMMPFEIDPPQPGFLEGVRDLAHAHGALFILDEMRSGFRFGLGGAQEFLGVTADLVTYSKAMANGFALSCIAGRADILRGLRDTKMTATYFAATEAMAAALCCIRTIESEGVPERVWALGERMKAGLRAAVQRQGIPATISGYPPCPFLAFDRMDADSNARAKEIFFSATAAAGLLLHPSHHWYLCAAHTEEDIDEAVRTCSTAMREVARRL